GPSDLSVDAYAPDVETPGDAPGGVEVRGEDGAVQPVGRAVGELDRGVGVGDAVDHAQGAEGLLVVDPHLRGDVGDDGGPEEGARAVGLTPGHEDGRALGYRVVVLRLKALDRLRAG